MKPLKIVVTLAALGAAGYFAVRAGTGLAQDVQRYNKIRQMSGEGPLWEEIPAILLEVLDKERQAFPEIVRSLSGLPTEVARYTVISSM